MKSRLLSVFCVLIVLLFSYTAVSKLIDYPRFLTELNNQVLPKFLIPIIAPLLPTVELGLVILVIKESTRSIGLAGSVFLMSIFAGYTGLVLTGVFHRIPCSCGGVIRQLSWPQHLVFNLLFVVISIWAYALEKQRRNIN